MLDKILGKKNENKKGATPKLRKDDKKTSDIGGRLKDAVGKITGKGKEPVKKDEKAPPDKKMPRPMPKPKIKPREKPEERVRLRSRPKPGRIGRRVPEDDQRTLIGAAVFGIILIILVGSGYYFLVYQPYQETLQSAKSMKLNETNTYFKGPLAIDPRKQIILSEINAATTPDAILAIDVLGPATGAWREYQTQQINAKKDNYGRIMVVYAANGQKNVIMRVGDAEKIVNQADASVLSNMELKTPDTVAVPIIISRLQAAGGLITVGNMVDVYLKGNQSTNDTSPKISGATVLAILRAKDSGVIDARMVDTRKMTVDQIISIMEKETSSSKDVEQLLKAAASGGFDEAEIMAILQNYGWRLSDFERASNLGELDVQYLVLLEVPRENVVFVIQNMDNLVLTVPTQQAPDWMIKELQTIYG
ncbi:MAG: DUF515 domain-containing protein [Euryarchaeota archaeon]|nr:DUF515 domain-containing protein [Euryarchaeota archaeon]